MISRRRADSSPHRAGAFRVVGLTALVAASGLASAVRTHDTAFVAPAAPVRCTPAHLNASALLPGTSVAVSPLPGSRDASAFTQVSFLGAPARALSEIGVRGSRTGRHQGKLRAYSQGDGASFLSRRPFAARETVTVSGILASGGQARRFRFQFAIAEPDAPPLERGIHHDRDPNEKQHFHSEPGLEPPALDIRIHSPATASGYVFAAPYGGPGASGPMIFDDSGSLVWFHPLPTGTESTNLQVQQLEGKPVLTYWRGHIQPQGFGLGEEIILDDSYREIARVHAGNGFPTDLHDFHLSSGGTALLTVFYPIDCDLRSVGGSSQGDVTDTIYQEVDTRTGLVRREWHSLDHVALADSYLPAAGTSRAWPFDYFHLNSVEALADGDTLISGRNTWGLYRLDSQTGRVLARIGGRHSTVKLASGAAVAYQHDAQRQPDGTITVFDNGSTPKVHKQSRGLLLDVDPVRRTDSVVAQYLHPTPLSAGSEGNLQVLSNGDVFVGWGAAHYFSEYSRSGQLRFDARLRGSYHSYRSYRFSWKGAPVAPPAVGVAAAKGKVTAYASWNGDTRTAAWRLLAGPSPAQLSPVASATRTGFETAIALPAPASFLAVQALDSTGAVQGTSATVRG
jgi:hypothetical protein